MATKDWDKVMEKYKRVTDHNRYGELAEKMLDLVNELRLLPVLNGAKVWTSLLTLVISVPKMSAAIDICWLESDMYAVELPTREQDVREERILKKAEVGPIVEQYLTSEEGSIG